MPHRKPVFAMGAVFSSTSTNDGRRWKNSTPSACQNYAARLKGLHLGFPAICANSMELRPAKVSFRFPSTSRVQKEPVGFKKRRMPIDQGRALRRALAKDTLLVSLAPAAATYRHAVQRAEEARCIVARKGIRHASIEQFTAAPPICLAISKRSMLGEIIRLSA